MDTRKVYIEIFDAFHTHTENYIKLKKGGMKLVSGCALWFIYPFPKIFPSHTYNKWSDLQTHLNYVFNGVYGKHFYKCILHMGID